MERGPCFSGRANLYAQAAEAEVRHLRTKGGRHEVDLIVERSDGGVLALEVELAATVSESSRQSSLVLESTAAPTGHLPARLPSVLATPEPELVTAE